MKLSEIAMRAKKKAGFIPYIFENDEPLFMFMIPSDPKFGGTKPQIAKGNVDPGETSKAAALREAKEELGFKISNLIHDTIHLISDDEIQGAKDLYNLTIFIGQVTSKDDFDKPHFETGKVVWLSKDDFLKEGDVKHHKIVEAAYTYIQS